MLSDERVDLIRRDLDSEGRVEAASLAARFGVSEDTIRRDLRELAKAGLCRKVYGGAMALAPRAGPIGARGREASAEKAALARVAARLFRADQTVFIDAGSTNAAIASALPQDLSLTVVTNAPGIVDALSGHPAIQVIALGGALDRDKGACVGGMTLRAIAGINAAVFVLGTCGVDASFGITAWDAEEAEVKRAMVANSAALVIAATRDKVATAAPFRVAEPRHVTHLVVESGTPAPFLDAFRAAGSLVHVAD